MSGTTTDYESWPAGPIKPSRPPRWPIAAATGGLMLSVAALAFTVLGNQTTSIMVITGAGYVLGSIAVAVFFVLHRRRSHEARQFNSYEPRRLLAVVAPVVLGLGLLAGAANAFLLATEMAKQ